MSLQCLVFLWFLHADRHVIIACPLLTQPRECSASRHLHIPSEPVLPLSICHLLRLWPRSRSSLCFCDLRLGVGSSVTRFKHALSWEVNHRVRNHISRIYSLGLCQLVIKLCVRKVVKFSCFSTRWSSCLLSRMGWVPSLTSLHDTRCLWLAVEYTVPASVNRRGIALCSPASGRHCLAHNTAVRVKIRISPWFFHYYAVN